MTRSESNGQPWRGDPTAEAEFERFPPRGLLVSTFPGVNFNQEETDVQRRSGDHKKLVVLVITSVIGSRSRLHVDKFSEPPG